VTPGFEGLHEGGDCNGLEIGGGGVTPGFERLEGLEVGGDGVGKGTDEEDGDVFVLLELLELLELLGGDCCFFFERRWKITNTMIPVIVNNNKTIPTVIPMMKPQFFDCGGEEGDIVVLSDIFVTEEGYGDGEGE